MAKKTEEETQEETALVPVDKFAIAGRDPQELAEIIKMNVGPSGLTEFSLLRIKVPGSGALFFDIEGEPHKEIFGVPVKFDDQKAYWEIPYSDSGGGSPPDCHSNDGYTGVSGIEGLGGPCSKCPFNVFGSAKKGKGKACKDFRTIFLVQPGELLPTVVVAPPTSLKNAKEYFTRLVSKMLPFTDVVMRITLEKDKSDDGIEYSKLVFNRGPALNQEQKEMIKKYSEAVMGDLQPIDITQSEVNNAETLDDELEARQK